MARITIKSLQARISELEAQLELALATAPAAPAAPIAIKLVAPAEAVALPLTGKAAAQAAARRAAITSGRCTRVVPMGQDWGFEFYGRKAA